MESYYYTWADGYAGRGITDDPRWASDKLPVGLEKIHVLLNGKRVTHVMRCRSGINGWVEYSERMPDDSVAVNSNGIPLAKKLSGDVEVRAATND